MHNEFLSFGESRCFKICDVIKDMLEIITLSIISLES